jgi:hypothetical protein
MVIRGVFGSVSPVSIEMAILNARCKKKRFYGKSDKAGTITIESFQIASFATALSALGSSQVLMMYSLTQKGFLTIMQLEDTRFILIKAQEAKTKQRE